MVSSDTGSPTIGGSTQPRRRSSLFENLENLKQGNANMAARRASLHDQKPQGGAFSSLWNTYVRGMPNSNK